MSKLQFSLTLSVAWGVLLLYWEISSVAARLVSVLIIFVVIRMNLVSKVIVYYYADHLLSRAHSSATITHETILSSVESLSSSQRNEVGNVSGSPEFFSIIPASLGENVPSQNAIPQNDESASVECPVGFESPALRLRRNSGLNVGSVDSNSYHKVDGEYNKNRPISDNCEYS